ncbi:hypothetical protein JST56_07350 [Candidatus Dependentiae bacterium]|jgi:hypothetical protein|nr:hypothetical protein [Candidatus Dependentiae bacterium]
MQKKLFINIKLFVLVLWYAFFMNTAHGMDNQSNINLSAADRAEFDAIAQECQDFIQNQAIGDDEMGRLRQEMERLVNDLAAQDPRPFADFQNKVLLEVGLPEVNLDDLDRRLGALLDDRRPYRGYEHRIDDKIINETFQITGHNLFQVMFMTARCGLDYAFLKQLKKYYFQSVLADFDHKVQQIIDTLVCVEQDEDGELLWSNNAQQLVQEAFIEAFSPNEETTFKVIILFGLYFLVSECYRSIKKQTLNKPWTGFFELFTENTQEHAQTSNPLLTGTLSLVDGWVLGGESSIITENLPTVRKYALLFTGYNYAFLNSSYFELLKNSLVLARFSRQTKSYFQGQTKAFINKNKDTLCAVINCFARTKIGKNQEQQKLAAERLKQLIIESYDYPFMQWVRFKGNCLFWSTIWIEMLLMLPAAITSGIAVYQGIQAIYAVE